jgi:ABC-type sugar transport system ATPase subunit
MLYVTHDQEEAMTLGDRIAVLREGRLEQVAPPLEVYRRPATAFVADFIGVPRINWFAGRAESASGRTLVRCRGFQVELPTDLATGAGHEVSLGVRPCDMQLGAPSGAEISGRIEVVEALGSTLLVHARCDAGVAFRVQVAAETPVEVGECIAARPSRDHLHVFDAQTEARLN